jgi:carbonic anhydrase
MEARIVPLLLLGLAGRARTVNVFNPQNEDNGKRESWGYEASNGPDSWPSTYATCAGLSQSPINLMSSATVMDPGPFQMVGYTLPLAGNVTNNGHTLTFAFTGGLAPYVMGGRLPAGERFDFVGLHWHWGSVSSQGSEHTLDGKMYPMEIHLVHMNNKYGDLGTAVQHQDGLAVLGAFYEVSADDNADLADILGVARQIRASVRRKEKKGRQNMKSKQGRVTATTSEVPAKIMLNQLLPKNVEEYYYYQGGLTTPTCDEVVLWTNFMSPVSISESQLSVFRGLQDSTGLSLSDNYRPPQPLNTRTIYRTMVPPTTSPTSSNLFTDILGISALAAVLTALVSLPQFAPPPPTADGRSSVDRMLGQLEEQFRQAQAVFN